MRASCRARRSCRTPARRHRPPSTRAIAANSFIPRIKFIKQSERARALHLLAQLFPAAAGLPVSLAPARQPRPHARRNIPVIVRHNSSLYEPFAVCISMLTGKLTIFMMSKRKLDEDVEVEDPAKKQRRSPSPEEIPRLQNETEEPEKRVVLKRLFGRYCSINSQDNQRNAVEDSDDDDNDDLLDENEDPLLDSVPPNMDPEQLGFLVCAQETLRFLHGRGFTAENPMFVRLRSRLLQGIADIAAA